MLAATAIGLLAGPALASAQPTYVGFQVHSLWYERSVQEMQQELNMIQQLGGNTVRVDVGWSSLETDGKGEYTGWYLEKLDRFMDEASSRQIKVIATLVGTPCWASTAPESLKQGCSGNWWERGVENYPPKDPADYADAARFITARYGTELAALELWNEPNTERFLIAPNRAAAYAAMVRAAYPAAKQGNAAVPVLIGALAAADRPFLEELYAQGVKGYFDGISAHPYNEWRDPYDRWQPQWKKYTFLPGIEWLHEAQQAAGDQTPLWITEFGWDTCTGGEWCVSEEQQATYTVEAFQILETMPYVVGATAYELRDESTATSEFEGNWGLVHEDFSPKPAFAAVQAQLHGTAAPLAVSAAVTVNHATQTVVVKGHTGTERQVIESRVTHCRAPAARARRLAMTNKRGRYRLRLGPAPRLKGCRVTVRPQRSRRSVTRRVPAFRRLARSPRIDLGNATRARG